MPIKVMARRMRYTYTHTYNILKGFSPVTEAFLWRFYATFVDERSPFYLPDARNALRDLQDLMTEKVIE